ncbi:MAG: 50S ribosomal protein L22 [Actinobacteria bacterium]|nr:50S ribosomal protein L22 [Actinomycetota bacterium]
MSFGVKTNERPGTRAQARYVRVSAYKAREVLDLIRGRHVDEARDILRFVERDVATVILKVLESAVANARNNDEQDPETLFVSACFADEGPTLKRWRPRARGRAGRIRKRTTHITVIVTRMADEDLRRWRDKHVASAGGRRRRGPDRARRVARSRGQGADASSGRAARVAASRGGAAPAGDTSVDDVAVDEESAALDDTGTAVDDATADIVEAAAIAAPAEAEIAEQDAAAAAEAEQDAPAEAEAAEAEADSEDTGGAEVASEPEEEA